MPSLAGLVENLANRYARLIATSKDKNLSDRVWRLFGKEQVAGRYGLSFKTCNAVELCPNAAFGGLLRLAGRCCAA